MPIPPALRDDLGLPLTTAARAAVATGWSQSEWIQERQSSVAGIHHACEALFGKEMVLEAESDVSADRVPFESDGGAVALPLVKLAKRRLRLRVNRGMPGWR